MGLDLRVFKEWWIRGAIARRNRWEPSSEGDPLMDGRTGGIFPVGRMGQRGLRVSRNLRLFLAPWPQGPEPQGGRGPLIADAGVLRG